MIFFYFFLMKLNEFSAIFLAYFFFKYTFHVFVFVQIISTQ